ncbi:MAG: alcohol dehydrogenase catalytic domain-containing protein, partial [Microbacterium sp.]|uniref:alcohol dehydrogenase catalytic domain-containing protein n=1 Tax=Microbacterium sp. TaxID=51671 RepID=UPI003A83D2CF
MTVITETMPAWCQHRYGGVDTVAREEVPVPSVGPDEVLLRLHATGLNNGDIRVMRGEPLLVRTAFGLRRPRQPIRGMDAAGTVVALGLGVTGHVLGDEVIAELSGGGLAPYAVVPASRLVPRPAGLDPLLAAALPVAGGTAWQVLEWAGMTSGHRVERTHEAGAGDGARGGD